MMSNIRIQLLNIINRDAVDSTNFIIAKYILECLEQTKVVTTQELAINCNVSKSSISRFCRKIGYEDFMELQIAVASYNSYLNERFPYTQMQDMKSVVQNYLISTKNIVEYMEAHIDIKVLNEIIDHIHDYERVILMGHVQSSFPAFSLQHYLTILHKFVYTTQDLNEQKEMLETLDENNLVIIFSAGGKFFERVIERVSVMNRKNIPRIYEITANKATHYPFVYQTVELWDTFDYSSSIVLGMYSNLIALGYRTKYEEN